MEVAKRRHGSGFWHISQVIWQSWHGKERWIV
jgi:hypothetical protein